MMASTIYTLGFTQKTLREFIKLLKDNKIDKILDIRINPRSQLSGFARQDDLKYVLELIGIGYHGVPDFAPTKELLKDYRANGDWASYERGFREILQSRDLEEAEAMVKHSTERLCLLCSEVLPDKCHRRLVAEYLRSHGCVKKIVHL